LEALPGITENLARKIISTLGPGEVKNN